MELKFSMRIFIDCNDLQEFDINKINNRYNWELMRKGFPIRKNSRFLAEHDCLVFKNILSVTDTNELNSKLIGEKIKEICKDLDSMNIKGKRELYLNLVSEDDQFGFLLPANFLHVLSSSNVSLSVNGIFI